VSQEDNVNDAAESNVTQLPAAPRAPKAPIVAGLTPRAIVPQDFDQVWRLALAIEASRLAPKDMDKAEQIAVAIMHGLEIGLPPMQSVQRIAVINGRPTLWGDAVLAVVRASGVMEWIKEWFEGEGETLVALCETKRRGDPEPVRRTFSFADAKAAGLIGKKGPWQEYRPRMMQMRARAFLLRDVYPDALGGFYMREEIEDERAEEARDVTPAQPNTDPEKVTRAATRPGPPPAAAIEHKPAATMGEIVEQAKAAALASPEGAKEAVADVAAVSKAVTEASEQHRRRPGPPPGTQFSPGPQPKPEPPKATPIKQPTAGEIFERFSEACAAAKDVDALNEAWEQIVEPHKARFTEDERHQLSDMHGSRFNELDGGE
jgi:hypothetical protein